MTRRIRKYNELAKQESNVVFGGRLAEYRYYDTDRVIRRALDMAKMEVTQVD